MTFRIIIFCFYSFFLSPSLSSSVSSLNPPLCNSHDSFVLLQFKNSFSLNNLASISCDVFYDDDYDHDYYDPTYNIQFKNTSYPKTASWGNDSDCCSWDGVTCDVLSGHVNGLDLSCSWLQGQLHPNNSLFQLSHLQTLNLAFNDFNGSLIPSQLGDLSTLMHLNLSSSNFAGEIPPKIAQLSQLVSLDLSQNYFFLDEFLSFKLEPSAWEKLILNMTDLRQLILDYVNMSSIAPSSLSLLMNLSSSLVSLGLSDTRLQGNITSDILCLENLQQLDLSFNGNIYGQLPKSNWSSPMSLLDLSFTNFFGEVPDSISQLKHLNHLNLEACYFEGHVPLGLGNLTQLTYLNLALNELSGNIPFLSDLENLTFLHLGYNKFFGEIPSEISQLSKLVSLDLSSNVNENGTSLLIFEASTWERIILNITNLREIRLSYVNMSSVTPNSLSSLRSLSSSLSSLSLGSTSLQGDITNAVLYLENLKLLYLGGNGNIEVQLSKLNWNSISYLYLYGIPFSGEVPDSIGHLKSLKVLHLSDCQFGGHIPSSFKNLSHLIALDISSNKFSGGVSFLSTLTQLIDLDLSSNKFTGGVSFLLALVNLTSLQLSNNSFSGQIPSSLSNLENLQNLDLSINNFSGKIPNVFGKLSQLESLSLNSNNFSGQVPSSLSNTSVKFLDLSFNMLQGNLPIPPYGAEFYLVSNNKFSGGISFLFCNATSLEILNLSHNKLSGPILQCLVGFPNLSVLDLQMNAFFGTLPDNFSKSNVVQTLHFNNNQLKGSLPQPLARCNQLEIFDVGHNEIKDTFPGWLDDLPELQVLVLRENRFYGAISSSNNTKHSFPKLRIFDISNNHFDGSLPTTYINRFEGMMKVVKVQASSQYMESKNYSTYKDSVMITWKGYTIELVRILKIFTTVDLSNNRFDGEIPKAIGDLHALIGLNLSHNRITGSIPKSIGKLTSLEWLDLSCNKLDGEIPQAMTNLNFLAVLNLSQNQLQGTIPRGEQFDTFQKDSYEGNLGLCGVPLSKTCKKNEGESPAPSFDADEKFGFGWKPVALGYGCGMVFGIFIGYIMLTIGKPRWLVRTFGGQYVKEAKRRRNRAHTN